MPTVFSPIGTYLFAALIVVVLYFRLRRTFGRQLLRPRTMLLRIVLFGVIAALVSPTALRSAAFGGAAIGGIAVGVLLGYWGASRTGFEHIDKRVYYVPHTYTGIAVSLLFVGRVAFRLLQTNPAPNSVGASPASGLSSYVSSPLTLGLLYVLVGYYVCYFGLVLMKSKRLSAAGEAIDVVAAPGYCRREGS